MADESDIVVNGIDGATGAYLLSSIPEQNAVDLAASESPDPKRLSDLKQLHEEATVPKLTARWNINLERVDQAGWGVVFHRDEDRKVRDALHDLVEYRRTQVENPHMVKVLEYSGESLRDWLQPYGVGLDSVVPDRVPYYLLLVGSPERIPFAFGHLLDVAYAVGRVDFDSAAGYSAYIRSVIEYERATHIANGRDVVFFGPRHCGDRATELSAQILVSHLANGTGSNESVLASIARQTRLTYRAKVYSPEESTKATLCKVFHPGEGALLPTFVFTASHGVGWPLGNPLQVSAQGALVCQDYPGPGSGPLRPAHYFAASDLGPSARVHGTVCFHFACYSVGTPRNDQFLHMSEHPPQIAPYAMFSSLPQALLSHRNGGALAVIGHVERAWPSSIRTAAGPQMLPFENVLGYTLTGRPLGYAMKDFNSRYAAVSTELTSLINDKRLGIIVPNRQLASSWTERNDAEGYVLFGDPAVRVRADALQSS